MASTCGNQFEIDLRDKGSGKNSACSALFFFQLKFGPDNWTLAKELQK
jgi:hypothetical protein